MEIGNKIRELRRARDISQETLARALGVSFQAVSKWETGTTLPDIAMIPAVAAFFGVSTDELLGFNLYEQEKAVTALCAEAAEMRGSDRAGAERILREGLKRWPGNEVILNNLLYVIPEERSEELIDLCRSLAECTRMDDVRFDALRIMASAYRRLGRDELVRPTLEGIPEIYFTKLELIALLTDGDEAVAAAEKQLRVSRAIISEMEKRLRELKAEKE